ncbi:16S rRNA (uracil(1498)-N(3))-methyltransferase [Rhizomonospora bruguierae]|uniref:16S rRNA (uracil(1498)-N(3))-methyltransferase n=1 Tax=Rhizomonospora bruguierae TaxID=1581705 RepID=UPI001BD1419B|nr:16S rRNA (uracil(1498)-N(3))-methyltransferase [Micromonospora sp. NBRC 107566]
MSAPLFLVPALPDGPTYTLTGPEGHHAASVQRLRPGEVVVLADGRGGTADATVVAPGRGGKGALALSVTGRRYEEPPDPRLVVVQGIAKGERGELAVQAMTEAGVDEIVPWAASRSVALWRGERGERSREKWAATAREAAKQARRAWVPPVTEQAATRHVVKRPNLLVLHEEATDRLSGVELPATGEITLVVGPEGGISHDEVDAFREAGGRTVRLGASVLRTSTAGVAAIAVLSARLGRW